jgi:hypothetical protein
MSEEQLKLIATTAHAAFNVALYLTSDNRYKVLLSRSDGKTIRTHEGDEYADIPTLVHDTKEDALRDALDMINTGGMT